MMELLNIDTSGLPTPRGLEFTQDYVGDVRMTVDLTSIADAQAWGARLGIEVHDTDPEVRYVTMCQVAGTRQFGPLRVHLVGTQITGAEERRERKARREERRAAARVAEAGLEAVVVREGVMAGFGGAR